LYNRGLFSIPHRTMSATQEIARRRTFAIISHPDAGKTTLTEKLLWFGGAIQVAGEIRARKAARHATSDWMELEKQRGISVTSSVMQFPYRDCVINLLDTPGHEDFSEDTYRTLTAVDSAVMVIDSVNGVEAQTIKLLNVCRLRDTPIVTFINKLDREGREPIELLDEIESVLGIQCAPMTWPIGMGKRFRGVYHLYNDTIQFFDPQAEKGTSEIIQGLDNPRLDEVIGDQADELRMDIELVRGASHTFDREAYLAGKQCPVFFGSAVNNFGVQSLLDAVVELSPAPWPARPRAAGRARRAQVLRLRVQDPGQHGPEAPRPHRLHPRLRRPLRARRQAQAGEHRQEPRHQQRHHLHGAGPQHHRRSLGRRHHRHPQPRHHPPGRHLHRRRRPAIHRHPELRAGTLPPRPDQEPAQDEAAAEGPRAARPGGATQLFRPTTTNELILGAVGTLQFDVVAHRLEFEYGVDVMFESCSYVTARWLRGSDADLKRPRRQIPRQHGLRRQRRLRVYLAPNRVNLQMAQERFPDIKFLETREIY
jgi:peptide chain release factor 3